MTYLAVDSVDWLVMAYQTSSQVSYATVGRFWIWTPSSTRCAILPLCLFGHSGPPVRGRGVEVSGNRYTPQLRLRQPDGLRVYGAHELVSVVISDQAEGCGAV